MKMIVDSNWPPQVRSHLGDRPGPAKRIDEETVTRAEIPDVFRDGVCKPRL